MTNKNTQLNPGKLWPIIKITVGLIRENPKLLENEDYLRATLQHNIPELNDRDHCANCGALMAEYIFEFDILDALLLLGMARAVRSALEKGKMFTDANMVRVQRLEGMTYAMKSRTTQCSKLGLIAKLKSPNGRQVPGTWVITKRGWEALSGKPVPKSVRVWRGKIEERVSELTTIQEALQYHREKVEALVKKNKQPKSDYRVEGMTYDPLEWVRFGEVRQGVLL